MNKLRRSEPFMFDVDMHDGSGHRIYWLHQSVPLQLLFFTSRAAPINRHWVAHLWKPRADRTVSPSYPNQTHPQRLPR